MKNKIVKIVPKIYAFAYNKGFKLEAPSESEYNIERNNLVISYIKNFNVKAATKNRVVKSGEYVLFNNYLNEGWFYQFATVGNELYTFTTENVEFYNEDELEELKVKSNKKLEKNAEPKYVIKYKESDKLYKDKKYKTLSDVFSGLMIESGYYEQFWQLVYSARKNENNPELEYFPMPPDWMTNGSHENPEFIKNIEIHKYYGTKIPTEKVDVDYYPKIKWHFDNIHIAIEYGLVVKDLFKKISDDENFKCEYILVYTHSKYYEIDVEDLKEEDVIKDKFKNVKKIAIKSTKYGRSAIGFVTFDDMLKMYSPMSVEERNRCRIITLNPDTRGAEIIMDDIAKAVVRTKLLERILA